MKDLASIARPSNNTLHLLVLGQDRVTTYPLLPNSSVRIGRAANCEIRIEEQGIAPVHALLVTQTTITVTNSAENESTIVGGQRLFRGESATLSPGLVLQLAGVAMVVQSSPQSTRLRHVRSHDYFEGRLEDECARAEYRSGNFGVVRVRFNTSQARALEEAFTRFLRGPDVVAMYAAEEYELLLTDLPPDRAENVCAQLKAHVSAEGLGCLSIGLACWPRDGRSPEALLAAAAQSGSRSQERTTVVERGAIEGLQPVLERIAPSTTSILILGETGVGKEVLAKRIHEMSRRGSVPMVCINCAALPEQLLENELFGSERGAFTGAASKAGLLEAAAGTTVLLDELGEMPLGLQAKVLRVVEQRQVTRLGGIRPRSIDVRFISTTNRNLEFEVMQGRFRADLFYRLNTVSLVVPPLRSRVTEIAPLAEHFIAEFSTQVGRGSPPCLSRAALRLLERYSWPGNVRELRNVIERAVMLCTSEVIDLADLPLERLGRTLALEHTSEPPPALSPFPSPPSPIPEPRTSEFPGAYAQSRGGLRWPPNDGQIGCLEATVANTERAGILRALELCCGNQTHAAQLLGISRRALITRLDRHQLPRPRKR